MVGASVSARVGVPTLAATLLTTAVAVAVNVATEWKTAPWAWVAVAVMTVASAAVSVWLHRRTQAAAAPTGRPPAASAPESTVEIRGNAFYGPAGVQGNGTQINRFGS